MANNGYEMTFHKLRHEFATTLNDLGVPSNYIQKLGGWSTDNVMKSVYTHTTSSKESEYQDKINKYFDLIIGSCDSVWFRVIFPCDFIVVWGAIMQFDQQILQVMCISQTA